jgi:perosamine synthetase
MTERINISSPNFDKKAILEGLQDVLESGQVSQGPVVKEVERMMTEKFESTYAAAFSNGTSSLRTALIASAAVVAGIDKKYIDREMKNREVIIPAFSFNATLNTVMQTGAIARVVDINESDFMLHDKETEQALNPNTIAIMPVDLYGQASSVSTLNPSYEGVALIRDAAQAHGAMLDGKQLVEHGHSVSLSYYPTKNVGAPEGGAVLTNNESIDAIARIYRNQGMSQRYVYEMAGDNLRMTDIHATFLKVSLRGLESVTEKRRINADLLSERLKGTPGILLPTELAGRKHVWHQYSVLVDPGQFGLDRNELAGLLDEAGIGSGVYYPKVMTDHETFRNHPQIIKEPTPVADKVASQVLSLPVHPGLSINDIDRITETIKAIQRKAA